MAAAIPQMGLIGGQSDAETARMLCTILSSNKNLVAGWPVHPTTGIVLARYARIVPLTGYIAAGEPSLVATSLETAD